MKRYLAVRLSWALVTVFATLIVVFILTRVIGNPVNILLPLEASDEQKALLAHQLGLDRPILVQLFDFLANALRGDFGNSWWQDRPALDVAIAKLPLTLELIAVAFSLAVLLAVPLGVWAAMRHGGLVDRLLSAVSLAGVSLPNFWFALMLIIIFGVKLRWLPTSGAEGWQSLVMPALSLALLPLGRIAQIVRAEMIEQLSQQYVVTARAKGLQERVVVLRHALKNAAIAVVTMSGWELARMLAGYTVAVEVVFGWPGLGRLIFDTIQKQDFPLLQAVTLVVAVTIALVNLAVDIAYAWIDPRIRYD